MNDMSIPTNQLTHAIAEAGYTDMITDATPGRVVLSVLASMVSDVLATIRRHSPAGAVAECTGNSNTDADGDTEEEIAVCWAD